MRVDLRSLVLTLGCLAGPVAFAQAPETKPDPWAPIRFMAGAWRGTASGEPGEGTAVRRYEFILQDRFLHERNTSTFPPQAKNKAGEVHEHWGFFSYDKKRKTLLFRQFHQESFVVTYAFNPALSTPAKLVFDSEAFENIPSTWKARETYERISADEFTETFEVAQADKPFAIYSRNHFRRERP
ncbi:hypothetical protein GETHLI_12240 [Geothrix limicola]|uniref:THAP4-like heme-binding beta-barrel domain-containing protein n=1 Tax=Geothrix limicola TaxID=2927978 RepID=A0ABQ5QDL1_9BACT|nr:hypothetical protein [Geothrix limicola]GLH72722.1 hypothetical protein GETHLI_12240 [Geothrix limicola]